MNDYVAKPITPELLFSVLTRWTRPDHIESIHREKQTAFSRLEPDVELPVALPGIHVHSGVARMAGNVNAYCRMLKDLHHFGVVTTEKMSHLVQEDLDLAIREVHTLKGTAANLSANDLQEVSLEFELALREVCEKEETGNREKEAGLIVAKYAVLIEKQLVQLEESLTELNELFITPQEPVRSSSLKVVDSEDLLAVLSHLEGLCQAFDPTAEDYWFDHKNEFLGRNINEEITRMENHLRNYNFESAVDFIGRIGRTLHGEGA
jgi:HPt (histidine-containing phosphotransfer) domain-containing protein